MTLSRHQAVGAYRRWTPPAFDAAGKGDAPTGTPQDAGAPPNDASKPSPATPEDTAAEPLVRFPTADEIETMYEQAREQGRAAGYAEGRATAHGEAQRLATMVAAMDAALDRLDGDVAEELVALAIAVARRLVRHTLTDHPAAIIETVKEALQQLPQSKVRVRLHPSDAVLVREYLSDQLEHGHHHLSEDETVTRGGCVLEAAGCEIDATIETRWRRILEGLGRRDSERDE